MDRKGLTVLASVLAAIPLMVVACGSDDPSASDSLPPIQTTTSSTVIQTTTTTWVPIKYTILPGDGLRGIADKFGVDIDKLATLNGITNRNDIQAGDVLDIPPPTTSTTTVPTATT
ncbi:MAG: LysM domain [Ilumatobacteraceae bacterium]|nr:LysM domain [Ilumatobacteraceae bacterium]